MSKAFLAVIVFGLLLLATIASVFFTGAFNARGTPVAFITVAVTAIAYAGLVALVGTYFSAKGVIGTAGGIRSLKTEQFDAMAEEPVTGPSDFIAQENRSAATANFPFTPKTVTAEGVPPKSWKEAFKQGFGYAQWFKAHNGVPVRA